MMTINPITRDADTRTHIKEVALKLFALHGVDKVSVRDILAAAGQKNGGSLHYHFGGKDKLILELMSDGACLIDAWRTRQLDAFEADGATPSLREILQLLTDPIPADEVDAASMRGYTSFMNTFLVDRHDIYLEGIDGHDAGFRRCVGHIRSLLPQMDVALFSQRLRFVMLFIYSSIAAREKVGESNTWFRLWQPPASRENFLDILEGMLTQPVSGQTKAVLDGLSSPPAPARKSAKAKPRRSAA